MINVIFNDAEEGVTGTARVKKLCEYIISMESIRKSCEIGIFYVDEEEMSKINLEFRKDASPTDVVSVPIFSGKDEIGNDPAETALLGDIYLCLTVAAKNAESAGKSAADEELNLVAHGLLHLLGYVHDTAGGKEKMFFLQEKYVSGYSG